MKYCHTNIYENVTTHTDHTPIVDKRMAGEMTTDEMTVKMTIAKNDYT
jgi:hypothetical protein